MTETNGSGTSQDANINDIVREQSETIQTLVTQFQEAGKGGAGQQPVYFTTPQQTTTPPNYMMYGIIGLVVYFIFIK